MATSQKRRVAGPGELGSIKAAKKTLAKKGGDGRLRFIPQNADITVRFLTEPDKFHGFYEHWRASAESYVPCVAGSCEDCDSGSRRNFRYLANAYVVDDSAVKAVKMPKTVFEQLMARYVKDGTIMDRDFELSRTGSGRDDTTYMVSPEAPSRMKLERFKSKMHDLTDVLQSMLDDADADDDDDDDEDERPSRKKKSSSSKKSSRKSPWEDDDDEDDEDEDEDDDDEDERPRRSKSRSASRKRTTRTKSRTITRRK